MSEMVQCFPATLLARTAFSAAKPLLSDPNEVTAASTILLDHRERYYVPREQAESNERHVQVVPYMVVTRGEGVFRYRRSKAGGEGRLHGLYSVGVGGHANSEDVNDLEAGMRELKEELGVDFPAVHSLRLAGLIHDRSNAVGRVHLGVVHLVHVFPDTDLIPKDPALADCEVVPRERLLSDEVRYETWSDLVVRQLL